ncbi:MAG: CBS domain-containing protein [Bryobacteraceae bacterium]
MRVRDIMTAHPVHCLPADSASAVARVMKDEDIGFVPICHSLNGRLLVGVVTDRDIVLTVVARGRDAATARMMEIMTLEPVTCRPGDAVEDVLEIMGQRQIGRLPVVDEDGLLVGIVTLADIAARGECPFQTARAMKAVSNLGSTNRARANGLPSHPDHADRDPIARGSLARQTGNRSTA